MPNAPEVSSVAEGGGWYGEHNGRMEKILFWGLLSNGRVIPMYAGDRVQLGYAGNFWHPDQYLDGDSPGPGDE